MSDAFSIAKAFNVVLESRHGIIFGFTVHACVALDESTIAAVYWSPDRQELLGLLSDLPQYASGFSPDPDEALVSELIVAIISPTVGTTEVTSDWAQVFADEFGPINWRKDGVFERIKSTSPTWWT